MITYTVNVKGKKYAGMTATVTVDETRPDVVGRAIDAARVEFVTARPELTLHGWTLVGFGEGHTVIVRPELW